MYNKYIILLPISKSKALSNVANPPKVRIEFYENLNNLKNINCFSNE